MCDTCLFSISASFLLRYTILTKAHLAILSSAPKKAMVEAGGTYTSPACHPHVRGLEQPMPMASPDTWWRNTMRQMLGTCCHPDGSTTPAFYCWSSPRSQTLAALLAGTWEWLLTASTGWKQVFKFYNNKQLTLSLLILIFFYPDKQGQVWPKKNYEEESEKHRIVRVGRALWSSSSPILAKAGPP